MRYWLFKSEPSAYSVDDLAREKNQTTPWSGVRNFQARNFMRNDMALGDRGFFYHSSCAQPGIVGIVEVAKPAYPDPTQFDRKSKYFDPDSDPAKPRWMNVDVKLITKTPLVSLEELRRHRQLAQMRILRRGNRLSVTPVESEEWDFIATLLR